MALTLSTVKLETITIDGQAYSPNVTVERRLRLAKASGGGDINENMLDLIAECFDEQKMEVREKLNQLSVVGVCKLQMYLLSGDEGIQAFEESEKK